MTHRDALVICRACGKRVPRKGRFQAYCSRRCRQRAYWDRKAIAKISATVTHDTGHSTTPLNRPIRSMPWEGKNGDRPILVRRRSTCWEEDSGVGRRHRRSHR
jgi:endogenous inhibitor of DNA gyrase (YacG/DUF329 family)